MEELAFTKIYDEFKGRIITDEHIVNDGKDIPVTAAWDTGTTYSCISPEFAKQINLHPLSNNKLHTSYGLIQSKLYDVLIGMDIISEGDFTLSTYNGKTSFSFRIPSKGVVDYTK